MRPATSARIDNRDDGRRTRPARGAQPRGDRRRAARLLRGGRAAAERARGRGARRRLGAIGAQPLRRRRGVASRGRAAPVGTIRALARTRSRPSRTSCDQRAAFFEAVTPVRRAALLSVHDSPTIARNLARLDRMLRRQLAETFPGITEDVLDAVDALTSWDTWNRLRAAQGCSAARAQRLVAMFARTPCSKGPDR